MKKSSRDDVDGYFDGGGVPAVFEPVDGLVVFRPAGTGAVVGCDTVSVVGNRPLEDVNQAGTADMVVEWAKDGAGGHGEAAHPQLAPGHPFDLVSEFDDRQ